MRFVQFLFFKHALVIVECGFLSNNQEALLLTDEKYQNKVAKAICSGTLEYLSSLAEKK